MTPRQPGPRIDEPEGQLDHLIESVVIRRLAGEDLPDRDVMAAHPDLMPRLGDELRKLGFVERARLQAATGGSSAGPGSPIAQGSPEAIPGYEVKSEIHRGGQGVVYRAVQRSTRREVALKILREGAFAGAAELSRFQLEVQVLARLRHPHIVTIYDSGRAGDLYYFAMDYVAGRRLDEYLDARRAALDDRPGGSNAFVAEACLLLAQVAEAVHAAHLRGIIHRDLKPSNVCVDSHAVPHVLDFGLAKVTASAGLESNSSASPSLARGLPETAMTMTGQFVGSLAWASPEQAEGRDLDIRTDVYSLGVMLHHALTREFPYAVQGSLREVLNQIAAAEVGQLVRRAGLDVELSAIVLRCLRKDPAERYQNAGALARDLRAYLAGEPVEARVDSRWYLLRKVLRRHRLALALGGSAALVLAGFSATMAGMYAYAKRAQGEAERRQGEAERQAARAERVQGVLRDMLVSVDPHTARGRDVTVREVLDAAVHSLDAGSQDAQVEADARYALGETYHNLSQHDAARRQLERALELYRSTIGPDDLAALRASGTLAEVARAQGRYEESAQLSQETIAGCLRALGSHHRETLTAQNNYATLLLDLDRSAEAEELARLVLEARRLTLGDGHADTHASLNLLATILNARGKAAEAVEVLGRLVEARTALLGEDHPSALVTLANYATLLKDTGRNDEALPLLRRAVELQQRVLGPQHTDTLRTMNNLAYAVQKDGQLADAEQLFREVLAARRASLGETHPQTLNSAESLAGLLYGQARYDEAAELCADVAQGRLQALSETHTETIKAMHNLAAVLLKSGKPAEAEPWFQRAVDAARTVRDEDDRFMMGYLDALARCLEAQRRGADVEPLLRELVERQQRFRPDDVSGLAALQRRLAECLYGLGRFEEAEPWFLRGAAPILEEASADAERKQKTCERLARFYDDWGRADEAAAWRAQTPSAAAARP
jgi:serine/threonine protein kinase/Tfp pilus assembly protein PilF